MTDDPTNWDDETKYDNPVAGEPVEPTQSGGVGTGIGQPALGPADLMRTVDGVHRREKIRQAELGMANVMHNRLMKQITDFEAKLSPDEEIAACLASFGGETTIRIENVGYHNPYFIVFSGTSLDGESPMQLVQHVSQISVLFVPVKVLQEGAEPKRIGFQLGGDQDNGETK
jgi:hypothetical protein